MENGFPEEQTLRSKSTKKKKRKRQHENDPECQPNSQETLESESVEVNNEQVSATITEGTENGPPVEETPKKKKKKEHRNNTENQPSSQEALESESVQVNNAEASTVNAEENVPPVEKTPKKKGKKELKNNTENQLSSEEKPQSDSVKAKVKKVRKGRFNCPDEIFRLEKKFLKKHKDERFAFSASKYLTPEDRVLMRNNWVEFFKEHPHPEPTLLLRMRDKLDEKTREEVDAFITEHNFYKRLVQGIVDNPRRIFRTAVRYYPYRSKQKQKTPKGPKPPPGIEINRDWTEENNVIFRDFIVEEMAGQENTAEILFAKVKTKIPYMNAGRCRTQWKNVTCWQIDHKWRVRSEPFSADDKRKLVEGVRDQGVTSEEEINWKKLSKEFPNSSKKELKYYWRNLVTLNRFAKLTFQDTLLKLYAMVQLEKRKMNLTQVEKLQKRKDSLLYEIASTKFKIGALQTKLEKAETNLANLTGNLEKTKQQSTDKVDPGLDIQKPKTVTEAQATPKTKTVTEAQDTLKTKSVTEAQATQKTKTVKTKTVTEAQATPKTKMVTEAQATPKTKTGKGKTVTEEAQDTPKAKTVTKAKTVAEAQVETVSDDFNFMDTSVNHMSRFFDDDNDL